MSHTLPMRNLMQPYINEIKALKTGGYVVSQAAVKRVLFPKKPAAVTH